MRALLVAGDFSVAKQLQRGGKSCRVTAERAPVSQNIIQRPRYPLEAQRGRRASSEGAMSRCYR